MIIGHEYMGHKVKGQVKLLKEGDRVAVKDILPAVIAETAAGERNMYVKQFR